MRFVIQRVTHASVTVDGNVLGRIGKGFLVLIGVSDEDTEETADKMIRKMLGLRIFEDENGKTNLDLPGPANRIWRRRCMNTSSGNAKSSFPSWNAVNSAPI